MWHSNEKNIRGECMKKAAFIKLAVFLVFVLFLFSTALSIAAESKKPAPATENNCTGKGRKTEIWRDIEGVGYFRWCLNRVPCQNS